MKRAALSSTGQTGAEPAAPLAGVDGAPSRLVMVDALRGFSLAGVALAHMAEQYIAGPAPPEFMAGVNGPLDQIANGLIQFFIVGKFYALFSILFGLSFTLQLESATRRGEAYAGRFLWRAALLLDIGYAHHLFYRGDILMIYAVLAPLLIPFCRLSERWLLIAALLIFSGIPRYLAFATLGYDNLFGLPQALLADRELAYFRVIEGGTLIEVFRENAVHGVKTKFDYQILFSARLYQTVGFFLIGLWLGKRGIFRDPQRYKPFLKTVLKRSALAWPVTAALVIGTFATAPQPVDFSRWQHVLGLGFLDWANLAMTLVIGSLFVLATMHPRWSGRLARFAPYGRMALTNYVLQTLLGTLLLFGWGLGLLGLISTARLIVVALCLITLQMLLSRYWLQFFRFGPLEWLWRSATYLRLQPLRKGAEGQGRS